MWAVLIAIVAFFAGVAVTGAVLALVERRIYAKHGGKLSTALTILEEVAQDGAK